MHFDYFSGKAILSGNHGGRAILGPVYEGMKTVVKSVDISLNQYTFEALTYTVVSVRNPIFNNSLHFKTGHQ